MSSRLNIGNLADDAGVSNRRSQASHVGSRFLHGEIFICVDEAIPQAKEFRTSWQSEIVRYIVHGVLHLLGHEMPSPPRAAG